MCSALMCSMVTCISPAYPWALCRPTKARLPRTHTTYWMAPCFFRAPRSVEVTSTWVIAYVNQFMLDHPGCTTTVLHTIHRVVDRPRMASRCYLYDALGGNMLEKMKISIWCLKRMQLFLAANKETTRHFLLVCVHCSHPPHAIRAACRHGGILCTISNTCTNHSQPFVLVGCAWWSKSTGGMQHPCVATTCPSVPHPPAANARHCSQPEPSQTTQCTHTTPLHTSARRLVLCRWGG